MKVQIMQVEAGVGIWRVEVKIRRVGLGKEMTIR